MSTIKKLSPGILLCFMIAFPSWFLGYAFPLIGGPVFGILSGMFITVVFPSVLSKNLFKSSTFQTGVSYTAKKLLQYAIILLGFDLNLFTIFKVGGQSLFI